MKIPNQKVLTYIQIQIVLILILVCSTKSAPTSQAENEFVTKEQLTTHETFVVNRISKKP